MQQSKAVRITGTAMLALTVNNIVLFSETWKARLDAMNKEQEALTEQAQQAVLEGGEAPEPSFTAGQFLRV